MVSPLLKFALFINVLYFCDCNLYGDTFNEELLLKPLYSEQLYAYFQFTTKWDIQSNQDSFKHSHLFPRGLAEIVGRYDIEELHISLTGGLWRYEKWGYPVVDAAPGLEFWTWFKPGAQNIDKQWKDLSNSLSGLLCASLNFIDHSNSLSSEYSLRPSGVLNSRQLNSTYLRYATLPREVVCTENLTPWKKLLPCDSKQGLASMLNSQNVHGTNYHSLGLHLRRICRNAKCDQTSIELRQTVSLVYDYLILGSRNWSFRKLFNQGLINSCPLATTSTVFVDISSNTSKNFVLSPKPHEYITSVRGGSEHVYAKYNVDNLSSILNIAAAYPSKKLIAVNPAPLLYANQYIAGFGQERGSINVKIYNTHWATLDVVVLQNMPWYVPVYLHTLSIKSNGVDLKPIHKRYVPGKERVRPYYVELLLRLPLRSETVITIDFDYVFLKWQEYPPDANHGFYIGSTIVSSYLPLARNFTGLPQDGSLISSCFNASRSGYLVQVRTESLLITLPTPDFSMPYNVICLACTVVALAFGPLHNITTKRLIFRDNKRKSILNKIKDAYLAFRKPKVE